MNAHLAKEPPPGSGDWRKPLGLDICIYIPVYIYIYMEREREREMYIYIYIYIYIYMNAHLAKEPPPGSGDWRKPLGLDICIYARIYIHIYICIWR